jgi:hypothetical protein
VAEEAAVTLELFGLKVARLYDVGVAGLHRLLVKVPVVRNSKVTICVAGMDGALPSVVGGLVRSPPKKKKKRASKYPFQKPFQRNTYFDHDYDFCLSRSPSIWFVRPSVPWLRSQLQWVTVQLCKGWRRCSQCSTRALPG